MREVKPVNGWRSVWLLLVLFHLVGSSRTHREHKVHNIVLYPGKHSWCKTTPIKQVVAWPGCVAKEIDNNVCVGACFSYTIPQTQPSAPGDVISPYCDSCQASEVSWMDVTLDCDPEEGESKPLEQPTEQPTEQQNSTRQYVQMKKKVQIIANCSCSSCYSGGHHGHGGSVGGGGGHGHHQPHLSLQHHDPEAPELAHQQQDVPELMGLVQEIQIRKNSGHASPHPHFRVNNHTLHQLLVDINLPEGEIVHKLGAQSDSEEEPEAAVDEVEHTSPSAEPPPEANFNAAAESLSLPKSAFEHPSGHHARPHHGHGFHHAATHLEVAHEKLHPAHEGTEVSYHENLINPEPSQDSAHADQSKGQF